MTDVFFGIFCVPRRKERRFAVKTKSSFKILKRRSTGIFPPAAS